MFRADRQVFKWQVPVLSDGEGGGGAGGDDAVKKAAFERDTAKAEAAKLAKQLDELKKGLPTDEQRAKWAALEKAAESVEEERQRKAGEFDALKQQMADRHAKELDARQKLFDDATQKTTAIEGELNSTLIGLAFAGAADLFGPNGKTVLLPEIAQAAFARHVSVAVDEKTGRRQVVVKDATGMPLVDPKTGQPMEFGKAMKEIVDAHPNKEHLLRGSGKSGSGSPGGGHGGSGIDFNHLRPADFQDPKVREALKQRQAAAGGLQIGPAWDRTAAK